MPPKKRHHQSPPVAEQGSLVATKRARGNHPEKGVKGLRIVTDRGNDLKAVDPPSQDRTSANNQPEGQHGDTERLEVAMYRDHLHVCSEESISFLEDAIDIDDYIIRLRYFWGYLFILVRNLKSKERQDIFNSSVPLFVQKADMRIKLEMEFDACYRSFQKHFIKQVEKYGRRWISSDACAKFLDAEAYARKQRKPKQFPMPPEPRTGQDLLHFEESEGLRWNHTKAIEFWSICLPAFEGSEAPVNHVGWFAAQPGMEDTAFQELSGVALELIRRFALFELRTPGGYSLEAHMSALRAVMPAITAETGFNLKTLPSRLGILPVKLSGIVEMPIDDLDAWPGTDQNFDESDLQDLEERPADENESDALFSERLKEHDMNSVRLEEGLPAADDVSTREYEEDAKIANQVQADIEATFSETLKTSLENDMPIDTNPDHHPGFEDIAIPQLRAPHILPGPMWSKRAEAYTNGNIWARQLMAQTDRALELQRLNALLVAANHAISLLDEEEEIYQTEISELQEGNRYLREVWQQVQERIRRNKVSKGTRDNLSKEADFLKQTRLSEENNSGFSGFSGGIGLRFRGRATGAGGPSAGHAISPPTANLPETAQKPPGTPRPMARHPSGSTSGNRYPSQLQRPQFGQSQAQRGFGGHVSSAQSSFSNRLGRAAYTEQDPSCGGRTDSFVSTVTSGEFRDSPSPVPDETPQVSMHDTSSIVAAHDSSQVTTEPDLPALQYSTPGPADHGESITADMELLTDKDLLQAAMGVGTNVGK